MGRKGGGDNKRSFWNNPYGGMFDFNHDGKEDLSEQWLAFKIFEQAAKREELHNDYSTGHTLHPIPNEDISIPDDNISVSDDNPMDSSWRETCEDGSEFDLDLEDFETEEEYEEALSEAQEKVAWREICEDGSKYGIEPEDYESEDEYTQALSKAQENEYADAPAQSIPLRFTVEWPAHDKLNEIREEDYPNKRRFNAARTLANEFLCCNDKEAEQREKARCQFIIDNADKITAANYLSHEGGFLYAQAVKENFEIPINLPDEDEWAKTNFFEVIKGISEHNMILAIEIWEWCIDNFMPYIEYGNGFDMELLTVTVLEHFYEMPDDFAAKLIQYIETRPVFSQKIIRCAPRIAGQTYAILHEAILSRHPQTVSIILKDILSNENADTRTIADIIDTLIYCCETRKETENMRMVKECVLPIFSALESSEYMAYVAGWNEKISSYYERVEQQTKEKEAKVIKKRQLDALIDSMKDIISRMEQGDVWEPFDRNTPETITYQFTYPNGKNGDIDMYIANRYGQIEQVDAVQYFASLPTTRKEQILLLKYIYTHSPHNDMPRNELDQFLYDYNLGHRLRQYCDTYLALDVGYSSSETEAEKTRRLNNEKIRSKAMEVANDYMGTIRCERNKVYAEIVEHGLASAQWSSEQKAYLIVKNLYPDTIFQYHAEWLGNQSLDIYIPSRKIGIEYQGKQHFEGVAFFGGDEGLRQTRIRDESKKKKCIDNGITLIEWRYDAPLTEEYIKDKISEAGH